MSWARMTMAIAPPARKKKKAVSKYMMPIFLWSVVVIHDISQPLGLGPCSTPWSGATGVWCSGFIEDSMGGDALVGPKVQDGHETDPDHVDEVPVPAGGGHGEMLVGGEVAHGHAVRDDG